MTPASIASLISSAATEFRNIAPQVAQLVGASDDHVSTINTAADSLQRSADAFAQAESTSAAKDVVDRVAEDVTAVANVVAEVPGVPAQISQPVRVATMLIPTFAGLIHLLFPRL